MATNDNFSIAIDEWLAPDMGSEVERATCAALSITIGNRRVTQVEDFESKTVRNTIRVSAEPIAKWLAANWWRLRWESEPLSMHADLSWAMAHCVPSIGEGYIWPDLVFRGSDGKRISVVCKSNQAADLGEMSSIRFLNNTVASISASEFERSVRGFIEQVILRLDSLKLADTELHDIWNELSSEWQDKEAAAHRKIEALLGLDPDENDKLVALVFKWAKRFGRSALEEISAASSKTELQRHLSAAKTTAEKIRVFAKLPDPSEIAGIVDAAPHMSGVPWQRGQALAYALRRKWELGSKPVHDKQLAGFLELDVTDLQKAMPEAPFSFAIRRPADHKLGLAINRTQSHGRRFDTARLIGDQLSSVRKDQMIPATWSLTSRQKFQRAFAAEFLCPSELIRQRYADKLDKSSVSSAIDDVSSEYDVSDQVVLHHMENREVLPKGFLGSPLQLA